MLTHDQIWGMIDWLAARHGLSPSGLAKRAGLDPTTFNRSKRTGGDGRLRWPSTESLAKVLEATNTPLSEFGALAVAVDHKARAGFLRHPAGTGFTDDPDEAGEAGGMMDPVWAPHVVPVPPSAVGPFFRARDRLIVVRAARVEPGDRILARTADGETILREIVSATDTHLALRAPGGAKEDLVERSALSDMSRVLWASQ
ncbi:helix-turn-helix transcriptional regulator [Chthonobacter rhizosphaerae]|uniref:helix-turn-helix transcriptional regulator n=1 Tax=Chthonobacter rhizosphaerae TaxID=2735553 RepID=UPI0015EE6002|nr:helix-turn-helix transcriptional regulator [Chthonobacter rhizosphaerae]